MKWLSFIFTYILSLLDLSLTPNRLGDSPLLASHLSRSLQNFKFHLISRNFNLNQHEKCQSLSCVQLFVTPWTVSCQAPLSMGFFRQEYWSRLPFPPPGYPPDPGIKPGSLALQADSLPPEPPGKPWNHHMWLYWVGGIRNGSWGESETWTIRNDGGAEMTRSQAQAGGTAHLRKRHFILRKFFWILF